MLSSIEFIKQSLGVHLFFARIMKEHSFFLQVGFTPKDGAFSQKADEFRRHFDSLLGEVVSLSDGVVDPGVLQSGEVITAYTLSAEMKSSFLTGVRIPTELTQAEARLRGGGLMAANPVLDQRVSMLNHRAIGLISGLIEFKTVILSNVLSCKMFTVNYPLLIEHILREAQLYLRQVQRLQNRENINMMGEALEQELFWNRIMAEHSKFIRGLLDPSENQLINTANNFSNEFDLLTAEALSGINMVKSFQDVTNDSLSATQAIRDFKAQGTKGLLECSIKSIIIPLLGDHTLREANHYLRLLKIFSR